MKVWGAGRARRAAPVRLSAEKVFRAKFPTATIERQRVVRGDSYYVVRRTQGAFEPSGTGDTKAKAWADAIARLNTRTR